MKKGIGSVRSIVLILSMLVVAVAAAVFFLRLDRDTPYGELPALLAAADAALSESSRHVEAASLIERAERLAKKKDLGVESTLSTLKRRRVLALASPSRYAPAYLRAALEAAERFPHSSAAAAVVVDAALRESGDDAKTALARWASLPDDREFGALKTLSAARQGQLDAPTTALSAQAWLVAAEVYGKSENRNSLVVDAAVSAVLSEDTLGARALARDSLPDRGGLSRQVLSFLAELEYDFGDRRESAALFSRMEGADASLRRADAAYLSGELGEARESWRRAAESAASPLPLYNLASGSASEAEALSYARRLRAAFPDFSPGIVLYSRLVGEEEGSRILSGAYAKTRDARVGIELVRSQASRTGTAGTIARSWLLLNADPGSETAARWSAWYAASNGEFEEARRLVRSFRGANGTPPWADFHAALAAAADGDLDGAEALFKNAAADGGDWRAAANIAALYEARRNPREALRRYELAVSLRPPKDAAAELQFRIAMLLKALGKESDARRTLEYALDLDPDNRKVRTELERLSGR